MTTIDKATMEELLYNANAGRFFLTGVHIAEDGSLVGQAVYPRGGHSSALFSITLGDVIGPISESLARGDVNLTNRFNILGDAMTAATKANVRLATIYKYFVTEEGLLTPLADEFPHLRDELIAHLGQGA